MAPDDRPQDGAHHDDTGIFRDAGLVRSAEFSDAGALSLIKSLMSSISDLVFVKDRDYRIVLANHALLSVYPEEMRDRVVGYTTVEEYDEAEAAAFLEQDRLAFETGSSEVTERLLFPDGVTRTLLTRKTRFEGPGGRPYIVGIARDISRIEQDREKLRDSEERYDLAVRGSAVGLWDWQIRTNELFWSDRFKELVGLADEKFVPHVDEFFGRLHPDDLDPVSAALTAHLESGEPYDVEYRLRREDGVYRWFNARGQAIWGNDGSPLRMAGSVDDIHDQKLAQNALQRSYDKLNQFAHVASHDLKEPLRGINSHAFFLREDFGDSLPTEVEPRLQRIEDLAARASMMTTELLEYSRLNTEADERVELDLNALLEEVLDVFADRTDTVITVAASLPMIRGEPAALASLFRNLIANGLKYNDADEKRITVGLADPTDADGHAADVFFVRDNGIGIAEQYFDQIFLIFRRLHKRDDYGGGTGAGLAFVRQVIERHGGTIWLDSAVGEGTTFFFTLST
ncbi:MAG: PAS domain-containing protein [Pseudomonadota bacterium]